MKETRKNMEEWEQKDIKDKKYIQSVLYFLLGILLSTCITAVSMAYTLPKLMVIQDDESAVPAVTSELVKDTINVSLGDYLSANKISISDDSMDQIVQYISDCVNEQTELTESELYEVKNLIKVSIQGANDNINTNAQNITDNADENTKEIIDNLDSSMITLQEFVVNGDDEISSALKEYIDNYVVPGITVSMEMNSRDIVSVNETIVEMGKEYDSYREINDTNLAEIIGMIETYREETGKKIDECQTELTEKINGFCVEYNSYIEKTDSRINSIETALGDYITVTDFQEFKTCYETYKKDMAGTVTEIEASLDKLEEKKADKKAVEALAGNFDDLKAVYDTFTGENGAFENLKDRVIDSETALNQNSFSIATLEERIEQLENSLEKSHPVGSVYMTFGNENPADLYGGTWERVEDTFLMCAGSAYPVGSMGGNNEILLGAANIPSLDISGSTSVKNGVNTSGNGAYSGTITSNGTYAGGTYSTTTNGEHNHSLPDHGIYWGYKYGNGEMALDWVNSADGGVEITGNAGNHAHTVSIPSQTIISSGNLSIGNHSHTVNIPTLSVTGAYTNNSVQNIDVTNKYVAVNVWKRVA